MSAEWTDKGPAPQSDDFKKAVEEVKKLKQSPTNEQLLTVYGLYKTAVNDPHFSAVKGNEPWSVNVTAAAQKWRAWKAVADTGITPEEAQKKYVDLVGELKERYGLEA
ncbi:uncharacterized protein K489DRAFT_383914 [Dissoconium aciculare CBS 342.82]|uniref:ACB domain-containing protein n=1 Tax=Dissoconium aciculare CBS 342.82 TaxID=1314786 RepID=A0A6J3LV73_9PEZI|nr:uncharacterized protein K489DRAFT_383914 [Dissoconium aciculare CBS 342.82]KAF1819666.1 hypothetical protein K489DRAFT_383914 [Dissoconium aciculare CBS 342.82]